MLSTQGSAQCKRLSLRFLASNFAEAVKLRQATETLALDALNTCWSNGGNSWQALAMEQSEVRETVRAEQQPVQQPVQAAVLAGPWQPCSSSCGGGWQERAVLCAAAPGYLGEAWQCSDQGLTSTPASTPCSTEACNGAQWQYEPWGSCSATCGGGTAGRTAVCAAGSGAQGADCVSSVPPAATLQRACNPSACALYTWQAGPWGLCSEPCAGGVARRTVTCTDQTGAKVDAALCPGIRPSTAQRCNLQPCDGTCDAATTCLGRGTCAAGGTCTCSRGFSGHFCQVSPDCTSNVTDATNRCCASGLADRTGICCLVGSTLDAIGACCAPGTRLDAAGTCGGASRLLDVQGAGCRSGVVDARGACCEGGDVDECGICGGSGDSCALVLSLHSDTLAPEPSATNTSLVSFRGGVRATLAALLQVPADSVEAAVSARGPAAQPALVTRSAAGAATLVVIDSFDISALIAPPGTEQVRSLAFSAAAARHALDGMQSLRWMESSPGFSSVRTTYAGRTGICGNGLCEVGERTAVGLQNGTCPQDCPIAHMACPSSPAGQCSAKGRCYSNTGLCDCFVGYSGAACDRCASGYMSIGSNCVPVYPLLAQTGPAPAPAPMPHKETSAPAVAPAAAHAPGPAQADPLFSSFRKAPGPAAVDGTSPAPAPAPKPERPIADAPAPGPAAMQKPALQSAEALPAGAPAPSPAAAPPTTTTDAATAATVPTPAPAVARTNATVPSPVPAAPLSNASAGNASLAPAPGPSTGAANGSAPAPAPDPGSEFAAQIASAAAQLTAELGRLAQSAPPPSGSASFNELGSLDAAMRQQASMNTRSFSASTPDPSPASGSWAANHVRLVIGIVFASLAGAILLGLAVCCCARCRRRAREGRLGRRLPAWLLPTPSPQRRPRSPLNLRTKYCGETWDPTNSTLAEDIEAKNRLGIIVEPLPSDGASGGRIPAFRSPVRPSRRGDPPTFGLRSQSEMAIRRPDGQFPPRPVRSHLSDPVTQAAAAAESSTSAGPAGGSASVAGSLHDGPLGSARLFYNPAFASSAQSSPGRNEDGGMAESRMHANAAASRGRTPMMAGDPGLPVGMSVYDNAMLEYGSELGSPDARHSSSRGASSSGGPSDGGPRSEALPGNFDRRHAGGLGRVEFAEGEDGQWHQADRGGGLPKLALTPGTAGRLRRPSRLLTLRQGPLSDKENVADESSSASPSQSPPRPMVMHHNPLGLETPPSSPEGRGSSMPITESPGVSGMRGGGMVRTPAGNALSLDSSHPSSLLQAPSPLETSGRSNVLFPEGTRPPLNTHGSAAKRGLTGAERRKRRRQAGDVRQRASDSCLPAGAKAGHMSFVPSPDGAPRRPRAGSHEYPPMPSATGSSWDEPGEEALAGRAFASGLASIQRNKVSGVGAKYRVVMFHQYPQELLRGWLRQHNVRDDQVDFWVLPPTPQPGPKLRPADLA
ncbi:probable disintegrin and metalloproteinase with thrombospondin motifs at N-terminal half [Coccomyxa sp. Obi]|nr:probable disintegrin and metalloproteinase with thrombospondin motifs at N-terminal half [Coccomyxa sp. Obi]